MKGSGCWEPAGSDAEQGATEAERDPGHVEGPGEWPASPSGEGTLQKYREAGCGHGHVPGCPAQSRYNLIVTTGARRYPSCQWGN